MYICVHICIHLHTYVPLKAGVQLQFTTLFQIKKNILCSHFGLPLFTAHKRLTKRVQRAIEHNSHNPER